MKKRFSLSRLLHNDKLVMLISLLLAIVVWAVVVYGPSNMQEQEITGIPVSVTLNDYASQTLNLRIVSGANATATVKVRGLRSVVSRLSAADITVTADTGNVIKEGTYTLRISAVSNGDYTITKVVGDNGSSDTVTISCDVWRETAFPVEVEMPNVAPEDAKTHQLGIPVVSGDSVNAGQVTVAGAKSDISRIAHVVAVIDESASVSEATVFEARLEARDEAGKSIESVSFIGAVDGKVSVTVPVMVYRKVELTPVLEHIPAGYSGTSRLITVEPRNVELWGIGSELDEYVENIRSQIHLDFDQLSPDNLDSMIVLEATDAVRPVNGSETLHVRVALKDVTTKIFEVPLSAANFTVSDCPPGFKVDITQNKVAGITLCGTAKVLNKIKNSDIRLIADASGLTVTGQQTLKARIAVGGQNQVWAYYGENAHGVEVLVSVE